MVGPATVLILRNVQVTQPHFAVVNGCERVGQRCVPLSQALYLGALQSDSGLEELDDRIVVPRFAIGGDNLFAAALAANRLAAARLIGHSYRRTYRRSVA